MENTAVKLVESFLNEITFSYDQQDDFYRMLDFLIAETDFTTNTKIIKMLKRKLLSAVVIKFIPRERYDHYLRLLRIHDALQLR